MDRCRRCEVELVPGDNWPPSHRRWGKFHCRPCIAGVRYANIDARRAKDREWSQKNRARKAATNRVWRAENRERCRQHCAAYEARKRSQSDPAADQTKIQAVYDLAATLSRVTGKPFHVDHIQSLASGGFHHEDNLVVMAGPLNQSKGAQHWPWLVWFNQPPI